MQLIEHKTYGKGKILSKRYGGFELYVEFEDGLRRWVRRDEIRFLSEAPILAKHQDTKPVLSEKRFKAIQIIEALRLGIIPHEYAEGFTFGREEEIDNIKNWLNNPDNSSLIVVGEYGVGKTHLLEYIYSTALKDNWAVSMINLDPNEVSFHKPRVIYQQIISSFKFKQKNGDFRTFLKQIANSSRFYELESHEYLSSIVEKIRNETADEDVWEWIEGKPTRYQYPPLYDSSTCANVYCYLLSGIGWAARNILKKEGLLILFDEAENVDPYWFSSYQNNKVWNFLRGLIFMTKNDEILLKEVQEDALYKHYTHKGWRGRYTNLQYCGHNQLPFVWRIPCCVKIIFAFTPTSIFSREPLKSIAKLELEQLDKNVLIEILESVKELYKTASNFECIDFSNLRSGVPIDKTRRFIKGIIEALDIQRFSR